jgi:UDP-N-acetyl-D-mannosaminuronate dehydrogenase
MSFSELRDALNTKWNVNILEPREGIGGHCLPKDTKMFLQSSSKLSKGTILAAAIQADQNYRKYRLEKSNAVVHSTSRSGRVELSVTDIHDLNVKARGNFTE